MSASRMAFNMQRVLALACQAIFMTNRPQPPRRPAPPDTTGDRFCHILVPTDLSDRTEKALQLGIRLASREDARVTLIHVIETIHGLSIRELKPFYDRLDRRARKTMDAWTRAREGGPAVVSTVVLGARAEEIVKYAAANDVDLIVLASHRVNPSIVGRDWGTISYKVGILAQCPVLLVK